MTRRVRLGLLAALLGCGVAVTGASALAIGEESAAGDSASLPTNDGVHWLMDQLRQKERSLEHREATLTAREADLRLAEKKLDERMMALQSLRAEVGQQLQGLDAAHEERVVGLVRMFEGMKPREAAPILEAAEIEVALEVLQRMNRMKAGKVLAEMDPEKASTLAERYAEGPRLAATAGSP
jgi:flagellar motility protein MotE (MotC chaperone)